ncbi:MAG TPA: EamA family transporter [Rhizomicrobium sp.]|jgi:drug/metabolite transporter (DMT)-like permease
MTPSWLWAVFTVFAAAGQTGRNAVQRTLTSTLGAAGATHVRFLFGFPFAVVFLAGYIAMAHQPLPHAGVGFWLWLFLGAVAQIIATALMLLLMEERSFVVATAYIKIEPVFVAIFGLVFLNDLLSAVMMAAIAICMAGLILLSIAPRGGLGNTRVATLGLTSGALFALGAIGFRGAILSLHDSDFVMAATFTLVTGLILQALLLTIYLAIRSPSVLRALAAAWRPALLGGFLGALTSGFWFLAFALATAASVRTLGLVDVVFAQGVSRFVFKHHTTPREYAGILLILAGAILLVVVHR